MVEDLGEFRGGRSSYVVLFESYCDASCLNTMFMAVAYQGNSNDLSAKDPPASVGLSKRSRAASPSA